MSPDLWQGQSLDAFRRGAVLSRKELWVRYIALGGMHGIDDLTRYLAGATGVTRLEHNTLVQALNEHFVDVGGNHPVPYEEDPPQ